MQVAFSPGWDPGLDLSCREGQLSQCMFFYLCFLVVDVTCDQLLQGPVVSTSLLRWTVSWEWRPESTLSPSSCFRLSFLTTSVNEPGRQRLSANQCGAHTACGEAAPSNGVSDPRFSSAGSRETVTACLGGLSTA